VTGTAIFKVSADHFRKDISKVRTGRANLSLFEDIKVEYYGTLTPVSQLANLGIPNPTLTTVQPWHPTLLEPIDKAIPGSSKTSPRPRKKRSSSAERFPAWYSHPTVQAEIDRLLRRGIDKRRDRGARLRGGGGAEPAGRKVINETRRGQEA
jgi:hypothetical protein